LLRKEKAQKSNLPPQNTAENNKCNRKRLANIEGGRWWHALLVFLLCIFKIKQNMNNMKTLLKKIGLNGFNWKQILLIVWLVISIAAFLSCDYDKSPSYALPMFTANVIITLILVKLFIPDSFWNDKEKK
jgi:hypothetical protein